jgi:hypothetical protein
MARIGDIARTLVVTVHDHPTRLRHKCRRQRAAAAAARRARPQRDLSAPRDGRISAVARRKGADSPRERGGLAHEKSVEEQRAQVVDTSCEIWHKMLDDLGERGRLQA